MNVLKRLIFSAGQQTAEGFYEASLVIYGVEIPCTASRVRDDWILANGLSPKLFIEQVSFFRDALDPKYVEATRKGVFCTLKLNPDAKPIELQLWDGGLRGDGLVFEFAAADRNFKA